MTSVTVLSREQLINIGQFILRTSTSELVRLQIQHTVRSVTQIAGNRVRTSDDGDTLDVWIQTTDGGRAQIPMRVSQMDEASLRAAVTVLDTLAREQVGEPVAYLRVPDGEQHYLPVALWHDATVHAMTTADDHVVPALVKTLRSARLSGTAFIGLFARATLAMQNDGLVAFDRETDAECTVSARTADGEASGWFGQAARDWATIDPVMIAANAIDIAHRSQHPSAVEPGRRTVILSPAAFAQILRHVSKHFDAYQTNVFHATAFAVRGSPERDNKIGLQVFDPRVMITSDPTDPLGGYTPFGDSAADGRALPVRAVSYVERGVLRDLSYNVFYGLSEGKAFSQVPWSLRFDATAETPRATIDQMIAHCADGIYVNRVSNVDELDPVSGLQTGVTRDGCFLIRNGKIERPVKNFRFLDSPFFFLNKIITIGTPERAAIGYAEPAGEPPYVAGWPTRPIIVPPVMVEDFNFSALSDAI